VPSRIPPLAITAFTATSALGRGREAHLRALRERRGGLRANDFTDTPLPCAIGRVDGIESVDLPADLRDLDSRNHRLAWLGLHADGFLDATRAAVTRHGAERVALLTATSTASIGATEAAYRALDDGRFPAALAQPELHTLHSLGLFLDRLVGARGPCMTVSTACSSSAKIFAQGERLIRLGLADAVILAGVDSLCGSVLFGFNALELVSPQACRPFDARRDGISIGEAAGFALLERDGDSRAPRLLGHGESSDAHHMSTPHPQGLGARLAIDAALARPGRRGRHRLHQPARHCDGEERRSRSRGRRRPVPGDDAREFDQGFHRPHARCGRHPRSRDRAAGARCAVRARHAQHDHAGRRLRPAARARQRGSRPARRAQQFVRLRRQQLRAGLRQGRGMSALALRIAGIGAWSPRHGAWPQWRAALRGETADAIDAPRPPATVLPQAERRRAPSTVLLACEAAAQACAMSSLDAANLPCVFACKHGEVAISDDMFATLAADPRAVADALPQFRAQRAGRLLDARHAMPCGVERAVGMARYVRRRVVRGRRACRCRCDAGAFRRIRRGRERPARKRDGSEQHLRTRLRARSRFERRRPAPASAPRCGCRERVRRRARAAARARARGLRQRKIGDTVFPSRRWTPARYRGQRMSATDPRASRSSSPRSTRSSRSAGSSNRCLRSRRTSSSSTTVPPTRPSNASPTCRSR
jgi:3-oxoacyl-[acyl-carrier-protein] synthase-1